MYVAFACLSIEASVIVFSDSVNLFQVRSRQWICEAVES